MGSFLVLLKMHSQLGKFKSFLDSKPSTVSMFSGMGVHQPAEHHHHLGIRALPGLHLPGGLHAGAGEDGLPAGRGGGGRRPQAEAAHADPQARLLRGPLVRAQVPVPATGADEAAALDQGCLRRQHALAYRYVGNREKSYRYVPNDLLIIFNIFCRCQWFGSGFGKSR